MKIPGEITAGDSISWDDSPTVNNLGDRIAPDTSWTLKYDLRQTGVTNLTLTAATQGDGWRTTLSAAQSAAYAAGVVYWQAYATNGSDRITLGAGQVQIKINLAAAANTVEFRSQSQQDLEAVEAAIRALVSGGVKSYTIGGRSVTKSDLAELIVWRDRVKLMVTNEKKADRIKNGLGNPSNIFVRFSK